MAEPKLPPDKRAFSPADSNPCQGCSNCCEYVSLQIDTPRSIKDFDHILWYVLHKDVWVYIDDESDWYIQFNTPCEKLDNRRCGYYETRPLICRGYEPASCVRYSEEAAEKYLFKNETDLFRYLEEKRPAIYRKIKERVGVPAGKI